VVFASITVFLWKDLTTGWTLLMTFIAPVSAFFAALLAVEFGVAVAALGTVLLLFLKGAVGLLIAVSKVGVIKGLFLPWLLSGIQWLHRKSEFLQTWVARVFHRGKAFANSIYAWWKARNTIDKILLLGFLGPLILVISFTVLIKRFVYIFISKKAAEQVVQNVTKVSVKYFHKLPLVGQMPARIKSSAKQLQIQRDRKIRKIQGDANRSPGSE
jgi:hypothetical protein